MKLQEISGAVKDLFKNTGYIRAYYHAPLKEHRILIESKNGGDLAGNMFHILKELMTPEYRDYEVFLSFTKRKHEAILGLLKQYQLTGVKLVRVHSRKYFKILATAKYLFTDTSFLRSYVKKDGQIITNTWHGTPLKHMGVDVKDRIYAMGNVQRNLLYADFLVYPNDFMKEKMTESYLLPNLYQGTVLCEGYPRNSCFFDASYGSHIRTELGLTDKKVFVYMPTWRGTLTNKASDQLLLMLEYFFIPLDQLLCDNQVFYVKLHPFVSKKLDLSGYQHIKPYPAEYDTYEFLNICDVLVTDYSSVFYDFANTGKKIILFAYDESQYIRERGLYVDLHEYPFPVVKTAEQLYQELCAPKNYDDTAFRKECCTYDAPGAAERICRHVIRGEHCCREEKLVPNGKKNVVLYGSTLVKNGMTTALINLFESIDLTKYNYYLSFQEGYLKKAPLRLSMIPEQIGFLPIASDMNPTFLEMFFCHWYYRGIKNRVTKKYKDRMYSREIKKHFGGARIDCMIQYAGYGIKMNALFEAFPGPRVIFVHNNMLEELANKTNQNPVSLNDAYHNYDRVAVVTTDIRKPTVEIGGREDNLVLVNNCHAYRKIRENALEPVAFDSETRSSVTLEQLKELLAGNKTKFITIGRFAAEKGHEMLIQAFRRFYRDHPDSCLIIIGGYGPLYNQTVKLVKETDAEIILIRSIRNPMPVLAACDFFLLSSLYEGLGLTLLEADTLGIPLVSTDVTGPQGFMREYGGRLVPPNEDGLYQAMIEFTEGKIQPMNVDFEAYNRRAVRQFEGMLEEVLNENRNCNL